MASGNDPRWNYQQFSPSQRQTFIWEPYAISSPRQINSSASSSNIEKEKKKKNDKSLDQEWLQAYLTYSPYRTSNQDYGAKKPFIHFIDHQSSQSNQQNPPSPPHQPNSPFGSPRTGRLK